MLSVQHHAARSVSARTHKSSHSSGCLCPAPAVPPPPRVPQYLPHVSVTAELLMCAAEQLPRFTPHSLALMLWSLGALRMRPNKEWMQLVLDHVGNNLW